MNLASVIVLVGLGLATSAVGVDTRPSEPAAVLPAPRVHLAPADGPPVGAYSLPVPDSLVSPSDLGAPHHDYPAVDLLVPLGTPLFAVHAGEVATHRGARCGLGVSILGDDGHRYVSCHLSHVSVTAGQRVRAGDVIGLSGDSGNARGVPHLHFHVVDDQGRFLCPQAFLLAWRMGEDRPPTEEPVFTGCTFVRDGARDGGHTHR